MKITKSGELIKIMQCMEALGYQVDSIEMLPEGAFYYNSPEQCQINIKASPLIQVPVSLSPEQKKDDI